MEIYLLANRMRSDHIYDLFIIHFYRGNFSHQFRFCSIMARLFCILEKVLSVNSPNLNIFDVNVNEIIN